MKLASQGAMITVDPEFAAMNVRRGHYAWGLPSLSLREKAFVLIAANLCSHGLLLSFQAHMATALENGVAMNALREAVRHLAPYVGYATAFEALMQLNEIQEPAERAVQPGDDEVGEAAPPTIAFPTHIADGVRSLNPRLAELLHDEFSERWRRSGLSVAERALCTLATDVLNGTLEESFEMNVLLALDNGAHEEQVRDVVLLTSEFGMAKAWRAFRVLEEILDQRPEPA